VSREAETVLRQAQNLIEESKRNALERATKAYQGLRAAQAEYEAALLNADRRGVSSSAMARAFGISETAVRLYIKRRKTK
jgi:DNA-directed RNA polymerase specialized sigma24 family protein